MIKILVKQAQQEANISQSESDDDIGELEELIIGKRSTPAPAKPTIAPVQAAQPAKVMRYASTFYLFLLESGRF